MKTNLLPLLSLSIIALLVLGFFGGAEIFGFGKYKHQGKIISVHSNRASLGNSAGDGGMMTSRSSMMGNSRGNRWGMNRVLGMPILSERGGNTYGN